MRNEYVAAENRILRAQIKGRLCLSQGEKATLAEIAHRLGRKALAEVAVAAKPDTIRGWFRKLVPASSTARVSGARSVGQGWTKRWKTWWFKWHKRIRRGVMIASSEPLRTWLTTCQTGRWAIFCGAREFGQRLNASRPWRDFIRAHMDVLLGTDFFTVDVLTRKGLVTYYVRFFIHRETRRVCLAGLTPYPDQQWMEQQARNVTMKDLGFSGAKPLPAA